MKAIWMLLLLAGPAMASDIPNQTDAELCVRLATAMITGQPVYGDPQSALIAELQERHEPCDPSGAYLKLATDRMSGVSAQPDQSALVAQQEAAAADDRIHRYERGAFIRNAGRAYLELQQQQRDRAQANRPTQTFCHPWADGMQCTSGP